MKLKQEMKRYAKKVKGKLTTVFAPEHIEALARQSDFIQRSSSKLTGKDFVELMTTEMIEEPAVSLAGLCDLLGHLNPQAQMTPQALHQRSCTCPLRINTAGSPVDHHRVKKSYKRGLS
jgi:hypothetical protein